MRFIEIDEKSNPILKLGFKILYQESKRCLNEYSMKLLLDNNIDYKRGVNEEVS